MALLLYGGGLRLSECLRLRVKDIDFGHHQLCVRNLKGAKDHLTLLPDSAVNGLKAQLCEARAFFEMDRCKSTPGVRPAHAQTRIYSHLGTSWSWFRVIPAPALCMDPRSGIPRRLPLQHALNAALRQAGIPKPATPHTLRLCFAIHLLESGCDICSIRELLGYKNLSTPLLHTHGLKRPGPNVRSPADLEIENL